LSSPGPPPLEENPGLITLSLAMRGKPVAGLFPWRWLFEGSAGAITGEIDGAKMVNEKKLGLCVYVCVCVKERD